MPTLAQGRDNNESLTPNAEIPPPPRRVKSNAEIPPPPKRVETKSAETNALDEESSSEDEPELPFEVYYNEKRKEYLIQKPDGSWQSQTSSQLKMRLRKAGLTTTQQQETAILHVCDHFGVQHAAPLAGKRAGFYRENGIPFLVTESPRLIEPAEGKWPTLRAVIEGLLVNGESDGHGNTQWNTLMGWLQAGIKALRSGRHQQAQVLAIAGERDSGKSLLQGLITELLGGRSAKPFRYMMGKTQFNGELFGAEHLMLEDEVGSGSQADRAKFGEAIKNFTVSTRVQSLHSKGRDAVNLPAFWRVSVTLNDEPQALLTLPPLENGIEDKIILLRGTRAPMPMPTDDGEQQAKFRETLLSELPAFLDWLLNDYEIPAEFRDSRFVVKTWHHPEIRAELEKLSPEAQLLEMIDEILWDEPKRKNWTGTAKALRQRLQNDTRTKSEANKLLNTNISTGMLLGNLAKKSPNRVEKLRTEKDRQWTIHRSVDA